jgi:dihydroorotase
MIIIHNVKTLDGQTGSVQLSSPKETVLDGENRLLLMPGLIDSHISCGPPDQDQWKFIIESAVRGGVTTLLDVPTSDLICENKKNVEKKREQIEKRLSELNIPLGYFFYGNSHADCIEEIGSEKNLIMGSLLLLTSEQSQLDDTSWDRIFQLAAWEDLPVVINSRNENLWKEAKFKNRGETLLEKAIYFAEKQNTRLYVMNVSTKEELDLINKARAKSLLIYAETTPQHLFPSEQSRADFLWEAINMGRIETIGSGYPAGEIRQERIVYQGKNHDLLNPFFLLPQLLTAFHEGKISLEKIVQLTRVNLYDIFKLERKDQNVVLIDLEKEEVIQKVSGENSVEIKLKGWPVCTIIKGQIFK